MSAIDASAFDGYEGLVAELRAHRPAASDGLRERVLAAAPSARRGFSFSRPSRRRLVLVVVPLAVAGAVTAAVVHGIVGSRSQAARYFGGEAALAPVRTVHAPVAVRHGISKVQGKQATTAPSSALAYSAHYSAHKATNTGSADSPLLAAGSTPKYAPAKPDALTGTAVVIPKNRLVHADATLEVQVGSHSALTHATNQATQIVSSFGGYAQSVRYQSARNGEGDSFLDLRVPVGKAQAAIGKLESLGTLVSQQLATQDLQQQVTKQTNRIGTLRRAIAVYEQALQSGTLTGSQRVEVQIRLANAQHELTTERKSRSHTVAYGATANISLTLTTNRHAIVPFGHHKRGRFGRLIHGAAGFLGLEGIIVLYALVVLSPFLVLGGLSWALLRERRRREERRLLAT
jgi:hypothetical protein